MALDTWKINSDQTQRFMLEWLNELNETIVDITEQTLCRLATTTVKLPEEKEFIYKLTERVDKLRRYSARRHSETTPSIDGY